MLELYSPLLLLQAACLYHAYRRHVEQRWYWLILFLPVAGCLIYLYDAFGNRSNLRTLTQGVEGVFNRNHRVEQLERAVQFNGNVINKVRLADAYLSRGRYPEAIAMYQECLQGFMAGDPELRMKLLQVHFRQEDYQSVLFYGGALEKEQEKSFLNSESRVYYAWALHFSGQSAQAAAIFRQLDQPHTHYWHRLEYYKFLQENQQPEQASEKLRQLLSDFDYVRGPERKLYRQLIAQARTLHQLELQATSQ